MVLSLGHRRGMSVGGKFQRGFAGSGDGHLRGVGRCWKRLIGGGRREERSHLFLKFRLLRY